MPATAFTEADVRRAVKGAMDAGFAVGAVEVRKDGTIRILPKPADQATLPTGDTEGNTCAGKFGRPR